MKLFTLFLLLPTLALADVKIVVAGRDFGPGKAAKGDIISVAPDENTGWGSMTVPPDFIRVLVTGASHAETVQYLQAWNIDYVFVPVAENEAGWRKRVEVDPVYISASELGKSELRQEMRDYVDNAPEGQPFHGSVVVSFTAESMTVDAPKNGTYQTANGLSDVDFLKALKEDFTDKFQQTFDRYRYYFDEADVDNALGKTNGFVSIPKAQALTKIRDKLDD